MMASMRRLTWLCLLLAPLLGWSAVAPYDYFTWLLEALPVFIGRGYRVRLCSL